MQNNKKIFKCLPGELLLLKYLKIRTFKKVTRKSTSLFQVSLLWGCLGCRSLVTK